MEAVASESCYLDVGVEVVVGEETVEVVGIAEHHTQQSAVVIVVVGRAATLLLAKLPLSALFTNL